MPLNPGNQRLTFNPPGNFAADQYHTVPASNTGTSFPQIGCSVQTATVKDKVSNTNYAEATHRIFTPYNTNTAAVGAEWHVIDGSTTYRVLGIEANPDGWGRYYFCEFICKEEQG